MNSADPWITKQPTVKGKRYYPAILLPSPIPLSICPVDSFIHQNSLFFTKQQSVVYNDSYETDIFIPEQRYQLLVADTKLYKRFCPPVRPSVRPSVRSSIRPSVRTFVCPSARVEKWENAHIRPCPPIRNWWPCIWPCFLHSYHHLNSPISSKCRPSARPYV